MAVCLSVSTSKINHETRKPDNRKPNNRESHTSLQFKLITTALLKFENPTRP